LVGTYASSTLLAAVALVERLVPQVSHDVREAPVDDGIEAPEGLPSPQRGGVGSDLGMSGHDLGLPRSPMSRAMSATQIRDPENDLLGARGDIARHVIVGKARARLAPERSMSGAYKGRELGRVPEGLATGLKHHLRDGLHELLGGADGEFPVFVRP
jgi:hypothetical protein